MAPLEYVRPEKLSLRNHLELDEKWVQTRIAEDPSILGLGDLVLKDKERIHPGAGRLDLLLQDTEANLRYEVEIQLGSTDPSHIIRTIEYWDIERKRYVQYDHVGVIVAENITSRFLNVISLFNGVIPLMALQMNAIRLGEQVALLFTTVLDQRLLGTADEEAEQEVVDRSYWERKATDQTIQMADRMLQNIREFDPDLEFKYNKFYIGIARRGQPWNFVVFRPRKKLLRLDIHLARSEDLESRIESAGLETPEFDSRYGNYRLRLSPGDVEEHVEVLKELLHQAYLSFGT